VVGTCDPENGATGASRLALGGIRGAGGPRGSAGIGTRPPLSASSSCRSGPPGWSSRSGSRGRGESDNLGRFEEAYPEHLGVIEETYEDVDVPLRWIAERPGIARDRLAVVGASYSGEAIGEALRRGSERALAYVILSPGSFSDESIAEVDASGVPWLFIRTREEGPVSLQFIDAVFETLARQAKAAELRVIPGRGHATGIFDEHPSVVEEVADWLAERLDTTSSMASADSLVTNERSTTSSRRTSTPTCTHS
jgi:dienelactone hydrolase